MVQRQTRLWKMLMTNYRFPHFFLISCLCLCCVQLCNYHSDDIILGQWIEKWAHLILSPGNITAHNLQINNKKREYWTKMGVKVFIFRFSGHKKVLNRCTIPKLTNQLSWAIIYAGPMKLVEYKWRSEGREVLCPAATFLARIPWLLAEFQPRIPHSTFAHLSTFPVAQNSGSVKLFSDVFFRSTEQILWSQTEYYLQQFEFSFQQ